MMIYMASAVPNSYWSTIKMSAKAAPGGVSLALRPRNPQKCRFSNRFRRHFTPLSRQSASGLYPKPGQFLRPSAGSHDRVCFWRVLISSSGSDKTSGRRLGEQCRLTVLQAA